ncbi:hypothetical protein HK099_004822 [Clydaea vesicula]|uniref:Uncharacterized protein n=1 Tax=Clydaea vesicula TaxID=447962 RepID=A0AAD5U084_9FUNG|nr:hypothetical protein HK099_004822 [Clydaea vesicula]
MENFLSFSTIAASNQQPSQPQKQQINLDGLDEFPALVLERKLNSLLKELNLRLLEIRKSSLKDQRLEKLLIVNLKNEWKNLKKLIKKFLKVTTNQSNKSSQENLSSHIKVENLETYEKEREIEIEKFELNLQDSIHLFLFNLCKLKKFPMELHAQYSNIQKTSKILKSYETDGFFTEASLDALQKDLFLIKDIEVEHHEDHFLNELISICRDSKVLADNLILRLKASLRLISPSLKEIYNRLVEIKQSLGQLKKNNNTTHSSPFLLSEIQIFQDELLEIDSVRIDGSFVDNNNVIVAGQGAVIDLLEKCYDDVHELLAIRGDDGENDQDNPLRVYYETLEDLKFRLEKLVLTDKWWSQPGGESSLEKKLVPIQIKLGEIDSKRIDGKFLDEKGGVPSGQAILHFLIHKLKNKKNDMEKYEKKSWIRSLQTGNRLMQKIMLENVTDSTELNGYECSIVNTIRNVLTDTIEIDSLSYDVHNTKKYFQAYYKSGILYQEYNLKQFNVFPLSTSTIPKDNRFDTLLLCKAILGLCGQITNGNVSVENYMEKIGSSLFNLKNKLFKPRNGMEFSGSVKKRKKPGDDDENEDDKKTVKTITKTKAKPKETISVKSMKPNETIEKTFVITISPTDKTTKLSSTTSSSSNTIKNLTTGNIMNKVSVKTVTVASTTVTVETTYYEATTTITIYADRKNFPTDAIFHGTRKVNVASIKFKDS